MIYFWPVPPFGTTPPGRRTVRECRHTQWPGSTPAARCSPPGRSRSLSRTAAWSRSLGCTCTLSPVLSTRPRRSPHSFHQHTDLKNVNRFHCCVNSLKHILILNNLAVLYRSLFQLLICFVSSQPIFFIILFNLLVPCLIRTSQALEKLNLSPKLRKKGFLAKNGFTFPKFPFWQNPIFPKVLDS